MANQMIALQARGPQLPDAGALASRYANMMGQMANMEKLRREAASTAAIRNVMSDPNFNPADTASLNNLVKLGPSGVEAAQQLIQAQKLSGDLLTQNQTQVQKRAELIGSNLVGILRDPSDENLSTAAQTFSSLGMKPAEFQPVLDQISKIPDANQRKVFALQFISQTPGARDALKYVVPNVKSEKVGDAQVFIDDNANSPTFGQELFRITASPEPIKMNQQVVDSTLYNVNPVTGVAQEATIGDATAGLVPQARTLTRTDSGVVSPYAVGMGGGLVTGDRGAAPQATPPAPQAPVAATPQGTGGLTVERLRPVIITQESGGNYAAVSPKGALGAYQLMPATAKSLAGRLGMPWRAELMTSTTPEARQYQDALGSAAIQEAISAGGGDLATTAKYYHGGSNRNLWGPKTQKYAADIARRLGAAPAATPTGRTPTGAPAPAPAPAKAPMTIAEAQRQKAFKMAVDTVGYNPKTGTTRVEGLIKQSTSGGAQMIGSNVMGFVTGEATPGRVALGELKAIANNMTFEKLRGKLGAQISDADVRLIASTMGDIANGDIPANERAAAWNNVVLPLLQRGANLPPKAAVDALRKQPSLRNSFDEKYGPGSAAKVLGR